MHFYWRWEFGAPFFVNIDTPGLRDRGGLIKGADFLHFYTLGTLAKEGRGDLLYNISTQTNLLQTMFLKQRITSTFRSMAHRFHYSFLFSHTLTMLVQFAAWLLLNALLYCGMLLCSLADTAESCWLRLDRAFSGICLSQEFLTISSTTRIKQSIEQQPRCNCTSIVKVCERRKE